MVDQATRHPGYGTDEALELCTYCPSLCHHSCPVATAEASDTVSPWGMQSLARHVRKGKVTADADIMRTLQACNGCGACTNVCQLEVPVMESLVASRADLVKAQPELALKLPAHVDHGVLLDGLAARSRFEDRPAVSLVPGRGAVPDAVLTLLSLCDRLDVEQLACGQLAKLDLGYDAWFGGDHVAFVELAKVAHAAAAGARDIVVMSAEAMFLLKEVYPRFGFSIGAEILHVSEMLLPILSGAVVRRLPGRVGYQESCHLSRHLGVRDVPRQVLRRVLEGPLLELPARAEITGCCGGTGRVGARTSTTENMAEVILEAAVTAGMDRLVSFSPECVVALRGAYARAVAKSPTTPWPRVDHAVALVAEAVVGDGAAA